MLWLQSHQTQKFKINISNKYDNSKYNNNNFIMTMFIVIGWRQVATNSWYKLQTDSSPSVACHMPDIHPLPIHPVLLLSHKDDAHFTIPQRMAGW